MAIPFNPAEIAIAIDKVTQVETIDAYGTFIKTVIPATPKKTGLAQGNWRTGVRKAPVGVLRRTSGAAAISTGLRSVKSQRKAISKGRNGRIFIVNNLPYIGLLNAGSSDQAPAFFIEVAFAAAVKPRTPRRKNI